MDTTVFSGCMPALMTPCKADRSPDFDSLVRKGKELVGLGMSAVVYCGSMGDWPLLTEFWAWYMTPMMAWSPCWTSFGRPPGSGPG